MTHTPGPYKVHHAGNLMDIVGANGSRVVHWQGFESADTDHPTTLANAHLLAAAPELLEALEVLLMACSYTEGGSAHRQAEAAIRKARGEA